MDPKTLPQMPDELLMLVGAMCHVRGEAEAKQAATKLQAWGAACYAAGLDRAAEVCVQHGTGGFSYAAAIRAAKGESATPAAKPGE